MRCHLLVALGPWLCHAQINRAVASIRGASGFYSAVTGSVTFEQAADDPLADITVRVSVSGLHPGLHGFHVHQYGDVRDTATLSTIGYHFVPFCIPPDVIVDPENGDIIETPDGCADDQVHGLPPDSKRQPGDMGNLVIGADGSPDAASGTLTIGQGKMSLTDPLRSIIGRTVIVHQRVDDGGQPYGNAGNPEAYGVIGIASTVGTTNGAASLVPPLCHRASLPWPSAPHHLHASSACIIYNASSTYHLHAHSLLTAPSTARHHLGASCKPTLPANPAAPGTGRCPSS